VTNHVTSKRAKRGGNVGKGFLPPEFSSLRPAARRGIASLCRPPFFAGSATPASGLSLSFRWMVTFYGRVRARRHCARARFSELRKDRSRCRPPLVLRAEIFFLMAVRQSNMPRTFGFRSRFLNIRSCPIVMISRRHCWFLMTRRLSVTSTARAKLTRMKR